MHSTSTHKCGHTVRARGVLCCGSTLRCRPCSMLPLESMTLPHCAQSHHVPPPPQTTIGPHPPSEDQPLASRSQPPMCGAKLAVGCSVVVIPCRPCRAMSHLAGPHLRHGCPVVARPCTALTSTVRVTATVPSATPRRATYSPAARWPCCVGTLCVAAPAEDLSEIMYKISSGWVDNVRKAIPAHTP